MSNFKGASDTMADQTANSTSADAGETEALKSISDAMRDAVQNATEDAAKVREKLAGMDVARSLSRFAYTSSYMISYGIVYGAVFVARAIPQDNPVMEGFVDGGRAALDALNEAKEIPAPASGA
jgi:outer membrane murein-binding lipoprotein Lpp